MTTEPFQVTHESLHQATNVLPDNVSAREAWFASMPFEDEIRLRAELGAPRD